MLCVLSFVLHFWNWILSSPDSLSTPTVLRTLDKFIPKSVIWEDYFLCLKLLLTILPYTLLWLQPSVPFKISYNPYFKISFIICTPFLHVLWALAVQLLKNGRGGWCRGVEMAWLLHSWMHRSSGCMQKTCRNQCSQK